MTLTEQWKKGELEAGWYYVKNEFGNIFISEYSEDYDYIGDKVVKDFFTEVSEITEVLAPVPSYEEWQQLHKFLEEFNALEVKQENRRLEVMVNSRDNAIVDLTQENQQLKELLKEIRSLWKGTICMPDSQEQVRDILTKIDNAIGEK